MTDTNKMRDPVREQFETVFSEAFPLIFAAAKAGEAKAHGDMSVAWWGWQASRQAVVPAWQAMDTCPQHTEVLFYRADAGVFSGMITDADHFLNDKERDEWEGTEQEMSDLDAFGFGDWGVCRCDGSERPTHWMPLPDEPAEAIEAQGLRVGVRK